ncbi:Stp1/IreP family PP2C-type Ser/Thr phosphatase [bacterium]|nr:Stp1/IreP family PP2C-type Ser/Thr phosphatase [bacterium]
MSSESRTKVEEKTEKLKAVKLPPFSFKIAGRSILGKVRENNEDKMEFFIPESEELLGKKGAIFIVADGMGGHNAGQIASELAVGTFLRSYLKNDSQNTLQLIKSSIEEANRFVFTISQGLSEREGMGCTFTVAIVKEDGLYLGHIGDSRLYLIRNRETKQLTEDHTWVNEQVKMGVLTREEAELSPFRNLLTRSLGVRESIEVDLAQFNLDSGDIILLCSDGFYEYIKPEEMAEELEKDISMGVFNLVELAEERGGKDNITALAVRVYREDKPKKRFFWKIR